MMTKFCFVKLIFFKKGWKKSQYISHCSTHRNITIILYYDSSIVIISYHGTSGDFQPYICPPRPLYASSLWSLDLFFFSCFSSSFIYLLILCLLLSLLLHLPPVFISVLACTACRYKTLFVAAWHWDKQF